MKREYSDSLNSESSSPHSSPSPVQPTTPKSSSAKKGNALQPKINDTDYSPSDDPDVQTPSPKKKARNGKTTPAPKWKADKEKSGSRGEEGSGWTPEKKEGFAEDVIVMGLKHLNSDEMCAKYGLTKLQLRNATQAGRKGNLRDKMIKMAGTL